MRFTVEATLAGRADQIKGYAIAILAPSRPREFDPQADTTARAQVRRLRRALPGY